MLPLRIFLPLLALLAGAALPAQAQAPLSGATLVSAGGGHTCALVGPGNVQCWGENDSGQLGDGTLVDRLTATDTGGLGSGMTAVAAGNAHSCAVTSAGGLKCWGDNTWGQLGDGSLVDRPLPVAVSGLPGGVRMVAAASTHSCALTTAGGVKCWGYNHFGQLGDGTAIDRPTPVDVPGLTSGVAAIAVGTSYSCALTTGGGLKCWGYNGSGQLGDGTFNNRLAPVDVSGLTSGVASFDIGGGQSCAVTTGGGAKCWGSNSAGQLGDGSTTDRALAADVSGLTGGVLAIATGGMHSCALVSGGGVKCWGQNLAGQLGDNSLTQRSLPGAVSGLASGATALSAGTYHSCALLAGGAIKCWGQNTYGQLGDNTAERRSTPVGVSGLASGVAAVRAGSLHSCAVTTGGAAKCWGQNLYAQLGDNSIVDRLLPVDVNGLFSGITGIGPGGTHSCALTAAGGVKCWGNNISGQLGDNTTTQRRAPVDVSGLTSGASAVAAGFSFSCALTTAGSVKCWGSNLSGQVGDGSTTQRNAPVSVSGITGGASAVATGGGHACALVSGGLKCWGNNFYGQLGDNSTIQRLTPVAVSGLTSGVAAVRTGEGHSCAVTTAGAAKCWGDNTYGQLGDNSTTQRNAAVAVSGLSSGIASIAAGKSHSCALTTAGGVKCWGDNLYGQLGDGTGLGKLTPVDVLGLASGVSALFAGQYHTCALTTGGGILCWGRNNVGQLGDGSAGYRTYPVSVLTLSGGLQDQVIGPLSSNPTSLTYASGATFTVSASGGGSGNPVVFSSQTGAVCTTGGTNGATVTMVAAGTCTIAANQAGSGSYNPAPQVVQNFAIAKTAQTIGTIASSPSTLTYAAGATFTVSAAGGASGNPVTYGSQSPSICTTGGANAATVTILAAGTCTITADQAGNANYNAAAQITQNLAINKASQAIGTIATSPVTLTYASGATFTASANGGASGNAVTFTSQTAAVCTTGGLNGATVTILAAGTCTIAADQAGNANYAAAAQVAKNIAIAKGAQQIGAINAAPDSPGYDIGAMVSLTAAGGASGNPVVFSSQTTVVCTTGGANGATVTMLAAGTCTIAANQAGNGSYDPAPQATRSFAATLPPVRPVLTGALSRKVHGSTSTYDLALGLDPRDPTTEPRTGGAGGNHTIVLVFDRALTSAQVAIAEGRATAANPVVSDREIRVALTGAANAGYVTVTVSAVTGADGTTGGSGSVRIGFLLGDVAGGRSVALSDKLAVNSVLSQSVTAATFLRDVDLSGSLTLSDVLLVNANLTQVLPSP